MTQINLTDKSVLQIDEIQ